MVADDGFDLIGKPPVIKTLRDEYAMAALTGLLANTTEQVTMRPTWQHYIKLALNIADEALRQREKPSEGE